MKTRSIFIAVCLLVFLVACTNKTESKEKQLRHVVLLKFKNTATADEIAELEKAFAELPSKIPQISDFEWGIDNSVEGLDRGFTHAFLVTFKSEEDRALYLPHEAHQTLMMLW